MNELQVLKAAFFLRLLINAGLAAAAFILLDRIMQAYFRLRRIARRKRAFRETTL